MRVEFLIAGAGLAGCALATQLARAGRSVALFDKDRFPRHKLCGEFLSPESQRELQSMGALQAVRAAAPATIRRARFTTAGGAELQLRLPGEGLGISRFALDARLLEVAREAGVKVKTGCEVRGVRPRGDDLVVDVGARGAAEAVRAGWVVMAHGRRGRLDHALERPFMRQRHPFVGLKRHHRLTEDAAGRALGRALEDHVEIHAFEGGYCGMSFVEGGVVNVCMLLVEDALAQGAGWDAVRVRRLSHNAALASRLEALTPADERVLAVAQVPFGAKSRFAGEVLFAGDAAGIIAPLTGDGQAMALSSASMLAELLRDAPGAPRPSLRAQVGGRWDLRWRRRFGVRLGLAGPLQARLLDAARAERTVRTVAKVPGLADWLARRTRG